MSMNRRGFLKTASAAGAGLVAGMGMAETKPCQAKPVIGKNAYRDRMGMGVWINDVRTEPLPFDRWPSIVLDDVTEQSIIKMLDLQAATGYNMFDVYGLFAGDGWPVDIVSAVDKDRDARVRRIQKAARDRGIKLIYGLGVYSWGFNEIIQHDPAVRGPNSNAMCASREESWKWQAKIIDFVMQFEFDGYHLEAADQGRCTCDECMKRWPVDATYYNEITTRTADYIRSKDPSKYILALLISWAKWGTEFTATDRDNLVELSKRVDSIVDPGHRGNFIKPPDRKTLTQRMHSSFGTSGGFWVYPPSRCHRLRWFVPYTKRTGTHIKELYADGGRTMLYYQGPVNNPGVEVNIAFGGKLMSDVDRSIEDILAEVLEDLYKPKTSQALKTLMGIFQLAEDAYWDNLDYDTDGVYFKKLKSHPGPGELHIAAPAGLARMASAIPGYIFEPKLADKGRELYAKGIATCLKNAYVVADQCGEKARIQRVKDSLLHVMDDVSLLAYARLPAEKTPELYM